jgi:hypothetical protein
VERAVEARNSHCDTQSEREHLSVPNVVFETDWFTWSLVHLFVWGFVHCHGLTPTARSEESRGRVSRGLFTGVGACLRAETPQNAVSFQNRNGNTNKTETLFHPKGEYRPVSKKKRLSRSKAEALAAAEMSRYVEMFLDLDHPAQSPDTPNQLQETRGNA